jgi:hypothetical protein
MRTASFSLRAAVGWCARSTFRLTLFVAVVLLILGGVNGAIAQEKAPDSGDEKVEALEREMERLAEEIEALKQEKRDERDLNEKQSEQISELAAKSDELSSSRLLDPQSWLNKFTLGGYGEMHLNFGESKSSDQFDIHRLVLYLGYDFNDWIKFDSEAEIEHAFVSKDSGGELSLEQAYFDFLLSERVNIRFGRILTPIGIINKKHEPPTFNGVERPSFAKYIIPTTWSSDGVGVFGSLAPSLRYEAYVVGGLDGSEFDATSGIREGRIKERPSLHEPAFTARLDWRPFAEKASAGNHDLRLGVSTYAGGLDNGNKGSNPDVDGDIYIYSADFEYAVSKFDLRGVVAHEKIEGAGDIGGGTASEILGWYLEGAYHFWPEKWKKGKLARSDAVAFVRYDDFDTQYKMPSGVAKDPSGDRNEWTIGAGLYLTPNFVVKADYQIRDDESGEELDDLLNVGVGWQF